MSYCSSFILPCLPSSKHLPFFYHFIGVSLWWLLGWQDVAGLPGEAQGVLRGSAGEPLAQNDVLIAPEAP